MTSSLPNMWLDTVFVLECPDDTFRWKILWKLL